jgi:site-specific DNA recombinase
MLVVRRIFHLVGVEGLRLHAVKKRFDAEGIATPRGARWWSKYFIRSRVMDDVYKPHTYEEVKELVSPEVAARLDPEKRYGIWWFNVRRTTSRQVAESGPDGERRYRRRTTTVIKPKDEWVAVPVPDAGISREVVDAAREVVKDNRAPSSAGHRFWELSGGVFSCGGCGRRMMTNTVNAARGHHYYRCPTRQKDGKDSCPMSKNLRADAAEPLVWSFVSELLTQPERLRRGLEEMIARERESLCGDPEQEAKMWHEKLAEAERKRSGFQDMAAEGLITLDELRAKLAGLEETRTTARRELESLSQRREKLAELERDRDTLLEHYAGMVPEALDELTPEERHRIYEMLRLRAVATLDGTIEVTGVLGKNVLVCTTETLYSG